MACKLSLCGKRTVPKLARAWKLPMTTCFRSKPELTQRMLQAVLQSLLLAVLQSPGCRICFENYKAAEINFRADW